MSKYNKVLNVYYTCQGLPKYKENAERLVSCWNACIQLEHPEEDIKKIIEALRWIRDNTPEGADQLKAIRALALVKEE